MLLLAMTVFAACFDTREPENVPTEPASQPEYHCGRGGYLNAAIFGAVSATIDWDATALTCEGMPRPEGRGARLRFAGHATDIEQDVAIIIAMPGLQRGATADELPTNATIILEGEGRFFSTVDEDVCWADVIRQEPLNDDRFAIGGRLYCIAPLIEVQGDAGVSITRLEFSGLLDWSSN